MWQGHSEGEANRASKVDELQVTGTHRGQALNLIPSALAKASREASARVGWSAEQVVRWLCRLGMVIGVVGKVVVFGGKARG